jgi:hypothetical protein
MQGCKDVKRCNTVDTVEGEEREREGDQCTLAYRGYLNS